MPKTAVHIDGDPGWTENEVGPGADSLDRPAVDPKSQAATMELRAKRQLGLGVAATEPRHLATLRGRGWDRPL
jgi:hypothetical protein